MKKMDENPQLNNGSPNMQTGIPGFDVVLGGGLPSNHLYLIQGLAGSGKTTLACQIGFMQAKEGKKVLVLTLIAESHAKLLQHLRSFSFFDDTLLGSQVLFYSGYNALAHGGLRELLSFISASLNETGAQILIVDGFRSVRESPDSDLSLSEFMHALNSLVAMMDCTTFLLSPVQGNIPDSENTLVDGLIELSQYEMGVRLVREIKVFKVRGGNHLLGNHVFEMNAEGIVIYPRLEAVSTRFQTVPPSVGSNLSFGIPEWDRITGGGIPCGSTTNLIGSPGVGKTLLGVQFLHEGLRLGENCLMVGFHESQPRLLHKAERVGIQLHKYIDNGQLEMIWNLPLELSMDTLAFQILQNIEKRKVTRLFIDGIEGFHNISLHPERTRLYLIALMNEIRTRCVTAFFTQELPYFKESLVDADSYKPMSVLYENVILLRYVQVNGINQKTISVVKMRESAFDPAQHIMVITDKGISIRCTLSDLLDKDIAGNTQFVTSVGPDLP